MIIAKSFENVTSISVPPTTLLFAVKDDILREKREIKKAWNDFKPLRFCIIYIWKRAMAHSKGLRAVSYPFLSVWENSFRRQKTRSFLSPICAAIANNTKISRMWLKIYLNFQNIFIFNFTKFPKWASPVPNQFSSQTWNSETLKWAKSSLIKIV